MYALLTDFGISKVLESKTDIVASFEIRNQNGLSLEYAAPELVERFRKRIKIGVTPALIRASDVYAVGALIYEVLVQKSPWKGFKAYGGLGLVSQVGGSQEQQKEAPALGQGAGSRPIKDPPSIQEVRDR